MPANKMRYDVVMYDVTGLVNVTSCSSRCDKHDGCWGPRNDQCLQCVDNRRNDTRLCVKSCSDPEPDYVFDDEAGVTVREQQQQREGKQTPRLMFPEVKNEMATGMCIPCDEQCAGGCSGKVTPFVYPSIS